MKKLLAAAFIPVLLALTGLLTGCAAPVIQVIPRMKLDGAPIGVAAGLPPQHVLAATSQRIVDLAGGGSIRAFPGQSLTAVATLTFKPVGLVNHSLNVIDGETTRHPLEIELDRIRLAGDGRDLYIAGTAKGGESLLSLYRDGVGSQPLLRLPAAIDAVTADAGRVYFAIGPMFYSFRLGGKVTAFARVSGIDSVKSMAVDRANMILYFCDDEATYGLLMRSRQLVLIYRNATGYLAAMGETLYLARSSDHTVYEIIGLPAALRSKKRLREIL